jgi:hypothetical protein
MTTHDLLDRLAASIVPAVPGRRGGRPSAERIWRSAARAAAPRRHAGGDRAGGVAVGVAGVALTGREPAARAYAETAPAAPRRTTSSSPRPRRHDAAGESRHRAPGPAFARKSQAELLREFRTAYEAKRLVDAGRRARRPRRGFRVRHAAATRCTGTSIVTAELLGSIRRPRRATSGQQVLTYRIVRLDKIAWRRRS